MHFLVQCTYRTQLNTKLIQEQNESVYEMKFSNRMLYDIVTKFSSSMKTHKLLNI